MHTWSGRTRNGTGWRPRWTAESPGDTIRGMAKPNAVTPMLDWLSYQEQLEQLPELPARAALYPSDFPGGDLATMAQAKLQTERWEREHELRHAQSGYLAGGYFGGGDQRDFQTPQERDHERECQEDVRTHQLGLPDSPEDMEPMAGGERERPF